MTYYTYSPDTKHIAPVHGPLRTARGWVPSPTAEEWSAVGAYPRGNVAVMCTPTGAYGGKGGSIFTDTAIAIGETPGGYHTTEIVPDGSGGFTNKVDGQTIGTGSSSSATVLNHFFILTQLTTTAQTQPVMRVKSVRLGDDVDLVPVRKGSAVGFYNRVDGHLFLEEQACLAAGPDK